MNYNTINGNIPYLKETILSNKGLKDKYKNQIMMKFDVNTDSWDLTNEYTLVDYDNNNCIVKNTTTKKQEIIPIALIAIKPKSTDLSVGNALYKGKNQVCRLKTTRKVNDMTIDEYHHPYPYSFYGNCPEFDEVVDPAGCQSVDDNKFYPCCKKIQPSKLMDLLINGLDPDTKKVNMIDTKSEYDLNSGVFYQGTFDDYFLVDLHKTGNYDTKVRLVDFKLKDSDKFVVEDTATNRYTINYRQIHPKYREKRYFNGTPAIIHVIENILKNKTLYYLYDYKLSGQNAKNTLENSGPFELKYLPELSNATSYFLVPKYAVSFRLYNKYIIDEYNQIFEIFQTQPNTNLEIYGSYDKYFYLQCPESLLNKLIPFLKPEFRPLFKPAIMTNLETLNNLLPDSITKIKKNCLIVIENGRYFYPTSYNDTSIILSGKNYSKIKNISESSKAKYSKYPMVRIVFYLGSFLYKKKLTIVNTNEIKDQLLFELMKDSEPNKKIEFLNEYLKNNK